MIGNGLPYRTESARQNPTAVYNPKYSEAFIPQEFIAVRDMPGGRFYIAEIISVSKSSLKVVYYGCTNPDLSKTRFSQAWHLPDRNAMTLQNTKPTPAPRPYSGTLHLNALKDFLVARRITLTKTTKLAFRAKQALAAIHDELFVFA